MNVIGFSLTKLSGERKKDFKPSSGTSTNIEFTNAEKTEIPMLKLDSEAVNVFFRFTVAYTEGENAEKTDKTEKKGKGKDESTPTEISIEGTITLSTTSEESQEILKSWKSRMLPDYFKIPIFNLILKKCSIRALQLEEELGLPFHISTPQIRAQSKDEAAAEDKK